MNIHRYNMNYLRVKCYNKYQEVGFTSFDTCICALGGNTPCTYFIEA